MNVVCERCSALFETSAQRPARYCTSCRELLQAQAADEANPTHAISDRPTASPRYLDDPYDDDPADISLRSIQPTPEEQRLADSGGFGLIWGGWLVIISAVVSGVLGAFNLVEILRDDPNNQVPPQMEQAVFVGMIIGIGCVLVLTLIPSIFMIVGGAALRRFSSRGLVITGVVFAFLMVAWYGFSFVLAVVTTVIGGDDLNLSRAGLVRAVVIHAIEFICCVLWIIVAVRALRILNRPQIARLFDAKARGYEFSRR
jgi:hypothetical protein